MKRSARILTALAAALTVLHAAGAQAAPFCVEAHSLAAECFYYDADQCRKRAGQIAGLCTVNKKEVNLPTGYGRFCLVGPDWVASCLYTDFSSCEREAVKNKGVCAINPARQEPSEPFRLNADAYY